MPHLIRFFRLSRRRCHKTSSQQARGCSRSIHVFSLRAHVCSTGAICSSMGPLWEIYPILSYPILTASLTRRDWGRENLIRQPLSVSARFQQMAEEVTGAPNWCVFSSWLGTLVDGVAEGKFTGTITTDEKRLRVIVRSYLIFANVSM